MNHFLFTRTGPDSFSRAPVPLSSYAEAVDLGQTATGAGNFYVEREDGKAPSREEQLLEPLNESSRAKRRREKLESL